jgi:NAD(P)-dependent dehydrogenase (short-subunit alcohol dehydrogenase family)
MGLLTGQAAFITGGGSGIGLQIAKYLVRDGASVTIAGRSEERLLGAVAELEAEAVDGAAVGWAACDVADEGQIEAAVAKAAQLGPLKLVVASAGGGSLGPIITSPIDDWNKVMATNLTGTFLTFKHGGAAAARNGGGAMLAISSIAGVKTHRFMGPYCVSKAGIDMLVKVTADELGVAGVRVNSVRPGIVDTDLVNTSVMEDPQIMQSYLDNMPISRSGTVDDVAALSRFLLGPESSWITGTTISVDGGQHLRNGPDYEQGVRAFFGDDVVEGRIP